MPALKICRICLRSEGKLYKYDQYDLMNYYKQVLALKIDEKETLPHYFCYECAALLHKFHKFKEKCQKGENVLKELLRKGPITLQAIRNIDKLAYNLKPSLNIITVSHRVRTYTIKSRLKTKLDKNDEPIEIDDDTATSDDEDDYENKNMDMDKLPPLPEIVDVLAKIEDDDIKIDEDVVMVKDEAKADIDEKNNNFEEEKVPQLDNLDDDIGAIDERDVSDDDNVFLKDLKASTDDEVLIKTESEIVVEKNHNSTKGSKKKNAKDENVETNKKAKQFEINNSKKKTELDPNNWLKLNLSEEEAIEEFKARAQHKTFISSKYKCNDCLKGFSKEDMLNRHVKLRHSESVGPVECRFCRVRFKWKCLLIQHMRQHYTKFKCLRCNLVYPLEKTALYHEEYHNGVKRKCAHCGEEFKDKSRTSGLKRKRASSLHTTVKLEPKNIRRNSIETRCPILPFPHSVQRYLTTYYTHLRTHRSEHVCTLCGASFVSALGLHLHMKFKHINAESKATEGAQGDDEYCKRCDIRFETKKAYEEHLIHSAMHVDGIEDPELQRPLGTNPRKPPQNLARKPSACHICGKHFATQSACRKHHLAEHPRMSFVAPHERHICEICGISLVPGSVSSHLNTHTREKIYACDTCGRQFNNRSGMSRHLVTHTSERTVPCTLCDKRFKQLSYMRSHYRSFHLKEPCPKRNRKKKSDDISKPGDFTHEESDDN